MPAESSASIDQAAQIAADAAAIWAAWSMEADDSAGMESSGSEV